MFTLNPSIVLCPGKLLLPALQSEMDWMRTLSQPKQGNQRVLSPGRWFSSLVIAMLAWTNLLPTHQGIALQDHAPAMGGGVQPIFLRSFSSLVSASFPLSCRDMVGCSVLLSLLPLHPFHRQPLRNHSFVCFTVVGPLTIPLSLTRRCLGSHSINLFSCCCLAWFFRLSPTVEFNACQH